MRLVIARCSVNYVGRLEAHLPEADRLIMVKADGSVSIHADDRAYKPLNWMTPPCVLTVINEAEVRGVQDDAGTIDMFSEFLGLGADGSSSDEASAPSAQTLYPEFDNPAVTQLWIVENSKGEQLRIQIMAIHAEMEQDLGVDPGLIKDGVEAHLQELLAEQIDILGDGYTLIRREYPTAVGPVDILSRDGSGATVAVEIKRRGGIDGVEQLTRYLDLLNRDELLAPVTGVFAAQEIKPQARTLAEDRGIRCVTLDYDAMRGIDDTKLRLF